jgi:catechol 2,3-dioxygenase-like lactoylglutathione lyase family enzyme
MRTAVVFALGLLIGSVISMTVSTTLAQERRLAGMDGLNHVGLYVQNLDEAKAFFTQKMGFPEAFTVRDNKGAVLLTYVQISANTFIELQPAGPGHPPGISHLGLQIENMKNTVATLKQRGVTVAEPRTGSTKTIITDVTGPEGVRIELSEIPPESLQRKSIDSWK